MNEAKEEGIPDFLSRLKPRGAPLGLRELVIATVEKELGQTERNARWFTQTERRCFQIAGWLLLASIAFCFVVELGEQSRMTRLDFKNEIFPISRLPRPVNVTRVVSQLPAVGRANDSKSFATSKHLSSNHRNRS
jgi:hypothetical protein